MTREAKRQIHAHRSMTSEPTIDEKTYRLENARAGQRIGTTLLQVAHWFLDFAQMDLTTISAGRWTDLQYEVGALAQYQTLGPDPSLFWNRALVRKDWQGRLRGASTLNPMELPKTLPPRKAIHALQEEVLEALTTLAGGEPCNALPLPSAIVAIIADRSNDRSFALCVVELPRDLFMYTFTVNLCWIAHRLRRCRECKRIFYADRKNKEYCGLACQNRAGTKRWRQAWGKRRRKK